MIPIFRRSAATAARSSSDGTNTTDSTKTEIGRIETRITIISDTHWQHEEIDLPGGDLLIHCGDMFNLFSKTPNQIAMMDDWFGRQKFERILYTGGNHDRELEAALAKRPQPLKNAWFLNGECIRFRGLTIFGAPWVPDLRTHAFYKDRVALGKSWAQIPAAVDILITHTPPKGILDKSSRGQSLGCPALAAELPRIDPRVHCFGHVHASAGQTRIGATLFINASSVESGTRNVRPPTTLTLLSNAS